MSVPIRRGWPALLILAAVAIGAVACDPGHTVTFENETSQNITIFRDGRRDFELKPFETAGFTFLEFSGDTLLEARNEGVQTIYAETFTWEELKEAGWQIVIAEPTPTPSTQSSSPGRKRP